MKTVTNGLREADKMFLELEEKRMEMEAQQKRKNVSSNSAWHKCSLGNQVTQLITTQAIPLNFMVLHHWLSYSIIQTLMKLITCDLCSMYT